MIFFKLKLFIDYIRLSTPVFDGLVINTFFSCLINCLHNSPSVFVLPVPGGP